MILPPASLACFSRQTTLVQAQSVVHKLVLLPCLNHPSPVHSELAHDAQHVHGPLLLQLTAPYRRGDEAAGPANPSTAVHDDGPPGARGQPVLLHLRHELQQRLGAAGGLVVGPGGVPVVLNAAALAPLLDGQVADGVVLALPRAVHQHLHLAVDPPLLRPVQNALLPKRKK